MISNSERDTNFEILKSMAGKKFETDEMGESMGLLENGELLGFQLDGNETVVGCGEGAIGVFEREDDDL